MILFSFKKKSNLKVVEYSLEKVFQLLILLLPTQLALHFWPKWSYVYGLRVDYLSPTIYLTDILILLILLLWVYYSLMVNKKIRSKCNLVVYFFPLFFLIINIFISDLKYASLFKWLKLLELTLLAVFIAKHKKLQSFKWIFLPLTISVAVVTMIAAVQIIKSGTVGGLLYFLGERSFSIDTPGIALGDINGRQFLRAYSTFPHPNALAGFMGVVFFLLLDFNKLNFQNTAKQRFTFIALFFSILGLVLAFSKTSLVVFLICLALYFLLKNYLLLKNLEARWFKMGLSILLISLILISIFSLCLKKQNLTQKLIDNESVVQRISLIEVSAQMINKNLLLGVGLNNFIPQISKYLPSYFWNLQPVHNIYILLLAETGLIGLSLFFIGMLKGINCIKMNSTLVITVIFILLTGLTDHYWLTIQQNLLATSVLIGVIFKKDKFKI